MCWPWDEMLRKRWVVLIQNDNLRVKIYNYSVNTASFFGVKAELNGTQKLIFGMIITDPEH